MQPMYRDDQGTVRFKSNAIVRALFEAGPLDMNKIANLPGIPPEDHVQFAQLIGYSVGGFCDLPYVPDEVKDEAWQKAQEVPR